jgi:hypothetical protein
MSIYNRYGQGPIDPNTVNLTSDNIERFYEFAVEMDSEVSVLNNISNLELKLAKLEAGVSLDDSLYTKEYIQSRISKLKARMTKDSEEMREKIAAVKTKLAKVNAEIAQLRPIVFDQELGKDVMVHIRMSELDDERQQLEDDYVQIFRDKYSELCNALPKVFYMILDGGDFNTIKSCFTQMRLVLSGKVSVDAATDRLMQESSQRYNLPSGFWDPLKGDGKSGKSKKLMQMMQNMNNPKKP